MTETTSSARSLIERLLTVAKPIVPARWRGGPLVPVVRLTGVIGLSTPLRPGLTLASVAQPLQRAFKTTGARAVALIINSPGGSPVQSHLIFSRIRQLADKQRLPVYAFVEDAGASGGYMLACAGDQIIADPSSVVGSIGVVGGSFGFVGLMEKLGIERRLYTSGEHKAMLDPFLPAKPGDVERLKELQSDIHEDFIALVKARRGDRLSREKDLFTGEYWTGRRALDLGLVDRLGDLPTVLREYFGDEVRVRLIEPKRSLLGRVAPGVGARNTWPAEVADGVVSALEARALWARYGL